MSSWSPQFVANMKKADIGCVRDQNHHFLIEEIGTGAAPSLTTIDGNTDWGRIQRRTKHKVGQDNFNYYKYLG
jgi:hypothetical protein